MNLETVTIKADNARGYKTINKADFDPARHQEYTGKLRGLSVDEVRGQNPSGTFSEPTPTDIRYPNMDATEFENNHGGLRGRSAAEIRASLGMDQRPGGIMPEVAEGIQDAEETARAAQKAAGAKAAPLLLTPVELVPADKVKVEVAPDPKAKEAAQQASQDPAKTNEGSAPKPGEAKK